MFLYETLRKAIIWTLIYTVANAEYILTQVTFGRIPGVTDNSNTQGQWHVCRGKAAAHTSSYWLPLMYEEYREFVLRSPEEENHWHVSILLDDLAKRGQESMQRRERLMHLKNCQKCAHMDLLFQHSPAPLSPIHSDVTGLLWKPPLSFSNQCKAILLHETAIIKCHRQDYLQIRFILLWVCNALLLPIKQPN